MAERSHWTTTPWWRSRATLALIGLTAVSACVGGIGGSGDEQPIPGADQPASAGPAASYAPVEARRLSRHELGLAIADLLGVDASAEIDAIAPDAQTPFDNDYTTQAASASLIEGVHLMARQLADRMLEERAPLEALLPCAPSGPDDLDCLRDFTATVGRRALRRPPDAVEPGA